MSNLLSARSIVQRWRLLVLPLSVLVLTIAVTASFVLFWKIAQLHELKTQLRSLTDFTAMSIDGNDVKVHTDGMQRTTRTLLRMAMSGSSALQEGAVLVQGTQTGTYVTWIRESRDGVSAPPDNAIVLRGNPGRELVSTGSLLLAYSPLQTGGKTVGYLRMTARSPLWYSQWYFLLIPVLFWWGMGMLISRFFTWFIAREREAMAQQIDSEKAALLELGSHQLGAPLATFRWWLELLRHPLDGNGITREQMAEQVAAAVDRMSSILDSMVQAGAINDKEPGQSPNTLASLRHVIERAVNEARISAKVRSQTITCAIEDNPKPVRVDPKRFFSVIQELLDNAMCYSPSDTMIDVRVVPAHNGMSIEIQDHGYGISSEDLQHMFRKFSRGSEASLHKPVGSGLGLYIAKGIIEANGGTINVKSRVNGGTTISIFLPYAKEEQKDVDAPEKTNDWTANLDPVGGIGGNSGRTS